MNLNTIDEVPDSNWFTNRLVARVVSPEEAARGPLTGSGPAPGPWTVTQDKRSGAAPGFTMRDSAGVTWFVSFDARGYPEAATGAILVANKIFWTLGYWQVENHLTSIRPENIMIAETAMVRPPSRIIRRMTTSDLSEVLARAHRSPDGSYRAVAARAIPGRPVDGFHYFGTRSDDPNDIVPHEHRRELRALKVFGAWTNLVDMKAGNTLDSVITENGRSVVRHYLQDVGSTFGTGANAPREYDEGWEYLFEGSPALRRLVHARSGVAALADRGLREARLDRPIRGRRLRSGRVEAARPDGGVPARAARRLVLGGPAGDGVHGRHDSRRRGDRAIQRSRRGANISPTC